MELRDALGQIEEIRLHLARTETFRGFKAAPVALSAVLAFAAAGLQATAIPEPGEHVWAYILLWMATAVVSAAAAGVEMYWRMSQSSVGLIRETNFLAIEQFLPSLVAGAIVTAVIVTCLPAHAMLLPGLWAMFFGLGILACWRLLPKPIFFVGFYYLAAGTVVLGMAHGPFAFSPWAMAGCFGVGQSAAAAVLYFAEENRS